MTLHLARRRIARTVLALTFIAGATLIGTLVHAALQPEPAIDVLVEDFEVAGELDLPVDVELRRLEVLDELKALSGHAWAGEYFHGDGEGMNVRLVLAPKAGAAIWWRGCLGLYRAEHGDVALRADGALEIGLPPAPDDEFARFPGELRPVRWGERRYLVEPSEFIDFVNEMNAGWEPRDQRFGRFLLAEGDEDKPAPGLPGLPPEVLRLVRSEPLQVRVLAVERLPDPEISRAEESSPDPELPVPQELLPVPFCERRYRLTFDRGSEAGLVPGVELRCEDECGYQTARVLDSDEQRSRAELIVLDGSCDGGPLPDRDWVFTTGAYAAR